MTRARRLLTLAYRANQRGETEIASRIATMAFAQEDAASLFEEINSETEIADESVSTVRKAEALLRTAEASTDGDVLTAEGKRSILAIAEKAHKAGFPKVAKSLVRVAY